MNSNRRRQPDRSAHRVRSGRPNGGPDNKANWQRLRSYYLQRAQAALDGGDRIEAENFYQHADHYFRMIQGTAA